MDWRKAELVIGIAIDRECIVLVDGALAFRRWTSKSAICNLVLSLATPPVRSTTTRATLHLYLVLCRHTMHSWSSLVSSTNLGQQ
jgi:hypothetical protein